MGFEVEAREQVLRDDFTLDASPEITIPVGAYHCVNDCDGYLNATGMPIKIVIEERCGKRLVTIYT